MNGGLAMDCRLRSDPLRAGVHALPRGNPPHETPRKPSRYDATRHATARHGPPHPCARQTTRPVRPHQASSWRGVEGQGGEGQGGVPIPSNPTPHATHNTPRPTPIPPLRAHRGRLDSCVRGQGGVYFRLGRGAGCLSSSLLLLLFVSATLALGNHPSARQHTGPSCFGRGGFTPWFCYPCSGVPLLWGTTPGTHSARAHQASSWRGVGQCWWMGRMCTT